MFFSSSRPMFAVKSSAVVVASMMAFAPMSPAAAFVGGPSSVSTSTNVGTAPTDVFYRRRYGYGGRRFGGRGYGRGYGYRRYGGYGYRRGPGVGAAIGAGLAGAAVGAAVGGAIAR